MDMDAMERMEDSVVNSVVAAATKAKKTRKAKKPALAPGDALVAKANEEITNVLKELESFLHKKNISYGGSAFKEMEYGGDTISPLKTVDVRITDKIRRLTGGGSSYFGEPDEKDLLGYLVIKLALTKLQAKKEAHEKQRREAGK